MATFCIGGAACRRAKCKDACKAAYGPMPDIMQACKNACKVNSSLTPKEFACSGNWIKQEVAFAGYGIDLCEGDANTIQEWADPLGTQAAGAERFKEVVDLFLIVLIIGAAVGAIYFLSK